MSGAGMFPQCMSAVRFHEMVQNGSMSDQELLAIVTDERVQREYAALRKCDAKFNDMLAASRREAQRLMKQRSGAAAPAEPSEVEGLSSSEAKYVGYIDCISTALCPSALKQWYDCLEQVKAGERAPESCALVKKMLERCLRAETDALFRATQQQVFRSTSQ